ncbi:multimeric flavodoxin WrbA [Bradyrhizobium sp. USDA 4516]
MPVENVEQNWDRLMDAEALIFGTPTYMGAASAALKAFQEATSRAVMSKGYRWKDKLAAGFANSGAHAGDKLSTLIQLALFAAQHGMHWSQSRSAPGEQLRIGIGSRSEQAGVLARSRRTVEHRRGRGHRPAGIRSRNRRSPGKAGRENRALVRARP